jgi:membrane associated rhomboid family serine protease
VFPIKDNIPYRDFPVMTVLFIVLNVVAYVFLQRKSGIDFGGGSLDQTALTHYAAIPYELTHPGKECDFLAQAQTIACKGQPGVTGTPDQQLPTWVTPFTAMFSHAGLLHLAGNMLFLWIFGNNVEDAMGKVRFVAFYLLGGLAALALQVAIGPNEVVPTLGASGAVAAVLGGYLVLYPRARVLTVVFIILFFTVIELPALIFLGIWFAQQAIFGYLNLTDPTGGAGGVAYFAHIGGFVFGLLAIKLFASRRNPIADAPKYPVY